MKTNTIVRALIAGLAVISCAAPQALARPGSLNRSFGEDGIVIARTAPGDVAWSDVAIDGQGRIVVLTRSRDGRSALQRFQGDGSLDSTFGGGDGWVPIAEGTWTAVAVEQDNRILIAGSSADDLALRRFIADGDPDSSFDGDGLVSLHIDSPFGQMRSKELRESFSQVAVRPDGRIVALGSLKHCDEEWCLQVAAVLAGYRGDGSVDRSFGNAGMTLMPWPKANGPPPQNIQAMNVLTVREDGRMLVGGDLEGQLAVIGFLADGTLDDSWGSGGVVKSGIETHEEPDGIGSSVGEAKGLLVQSSGRVVAIGDHSLLGLTSDGKIDPTFGKKGRLYTDRGAFYGMVEVGDATLDAKDRLLLAGEWNERSAIVRLFPDGRFDPRFAGDGLAALDISKTRLNEERVAEGATGIAMRPDGTVIGAGFAYAGKQGRLALANLLNGDGRLARCNGRLAILQGTPGPDRLHGSGPIAALDGNDKVTSDTGPICAGAGNDTIKATTFGTTIYGGPGDDLIHGSRHPDRLFGGPGNDWLFGGEGADLIRGGPGDDRAPARQPGHSR